MKLRRSLIVRINNPRNYSSILRLRVVIIICKVNVSSSYVLGVSAGATKSLIPISNLGRKKLIAQKMSPTSLMNKRN